MRLKNESYSGPSLLVCSLINSFLLIHLGVFWKITQHLSVYGKDRTFAEEPLLYFSH